MRTCALIYSCNKHWVHSFIPMSLWHLSLLFFYFLLRVWMQQPSVASQQMSGLFLPPLLILSLRILCLVQVREKVAKAPSSSRWGSSMELATQTKIREASFGLFTKTSSPPCRPWSVPPRLSRSRTNMKITG